MSDAPPDRYRMLEFEVSASTAGGNPYRDLAATAAVTVPGGGRWRLPLFWDGGRTWKLRLAPDRPGPWQWRVESDDAGLDGQRGEFEVVPSDRCGGVTAMAGHPLHFQRQDGSPFWFMGDTGWALFTDSAEQRHDAAAARHYVDTRAAQGFNAIHAMLISEAGWGNTGGMPFDDLAQERINPAYWQEVDRRLEHVNSRGVVAGLVLAWSDKGRNPNDWREFPSQQARLRYARYVAARYGAFDVYFVVAGEWNIDLRHNPGLSEEAARRDYAEIGAAVRAADPHRRMIAIHPGGSRTVREWASEPWIDFGDYQQTYRRLHGEALASRATGKPVVNAEYAYYLRDQNLDGIVDKDNSGDLEAIRFATWDIAMAGAYFVTGFGTTYFGGNRHPGPFAVDAVENDVWEEQVQHVRRLFADLPWWRLEPVDDRIRCAIPGSGDRGHVVPWRGRNIERATPPAVAYWALADEESTCVLYARGLDVPLQITLGAGGRFRTRLFDPRTGAFRDAGTHGGESISFVPPTTEDWILVAEKKES